MFAKLREYLFPKRLRARDDLRRFVSGEASYVAQRSTYEFVRNTLAWYGQAAFGDAKFNEAFAVCRWEAFANIAADMTMIVRAELAGGDVLDPPLLRLYADALGEYPNPSHRSEGWADRHAALLSRFAALPSDRKCDLTAMGHRTGVAIHDTAPAHSKNFAEERAVLAAAITFGLISFQDRLPRRLDVPALRSSLAAVTAS